MLPTPGLNTLMHLEILWVLQGHQDVSGNGGDSLLKVGRTATGVEKSLKSMHNLRFSVASDPARMINEYVKQVPRILGPQPGQVSSVMDLRIGADTASFNACIACFQKYSSG